jgi:hypothetical protein
MDKRDLEREEQEGERKVWHEAYRAELLALAIAAIGLGLALAILKGWLP